MNKLTKILLLALTLVLVIGASVAVVASAEDDVLPTIIGKNLVYTDMTAIQIAVDPATVDAKDVKLLATVDGKTATYTSYEVSTDSDVAGAYVFTIKGIPASAISDEVTIVVESGDKASEPFTYSVAEYFYERLYSDGIVNATEGKNAARKEFYETYIANGAAAQELFRNYDSNGNYVGGTTLVTNYNVLAVKDGVLANGKEVMLSTDAITSTVTANASLAADKSFTGKWTVTTYGDTNTTATVANGADVTSSGYVSVTPVYTDATGEYFLSSEKGSRRDYDTLTSISDTISVAGGAISISDGSLFFEDGAAQDAGMFVKYWLSYPSSYSCSVIEFDFKIDQVYGTSPISIFINGIDKAIYYTKIDNAFYLTMQDESGTHVKLGTAPKKWANIRIEQYKDLGKAKVYINNEFVMDMNWAYKANDSFRVQLNANERKTESDANLWIDNVYVGHITKTFVAGDPKAAN